MARAQEAQPAGDRERALRDLVESKFDNNVARFARVVAKRTGKTPETEKKAFYRILAGERGRLVSWRLGHYAAVLGVNSAAGFVRAWEEAEAEDVAERDGLPLRLSPREVRDALVALRSQVARLERQVDALAKQSRAKTRKGANRS